MSKSEFRAFKAGAYSVAAAVQLPMALITAKHAIDVAFFAVISVALIGLAIFNLRNIIVHNP